MITSHPDDPYIEGATLHVETLRADLAEAARAYYRPLTEAEIDDLVNELRGRDIDDRFLDANTLMTLFATFSHDH